MRDIHGADMGAITIAFLAGLIGVFVNWGEGGQAALPRSPSVA